MTATIVDIDEFRAFFIARGHKACERAYGVSNPVLRQLIARAGGMAVLAERAKLQPTGRRAGGR